MPSVSTPFLEYLVERILPLLRQHESEDRLLRVYTSFTSQGLEKFSSEDLRSVDQGLCGNVLFTETIQIPSPT